MQSSPTPPIASPATCPETTTLARPDTYRCVECGLPYRSEGFCYYEGLIENGPSYWSDRGILSWPEYSLAHHRRREAEGTLRQQPAADPFEFVGTRLR